MGRGLPEGVAPFALGTAILFMLLTIVKMRYANRWWQRLIPGGVSFAIGMFFSDVSLQHAALTSRKGFTTCRPSPLHVRLEGYFTGAIVDTIGDRKVIS